MDTLFDFERLDVYQVGRELNRELAGIIEELPRGAGEAADNLRRAGASITRNLAEANGKWTGPDKRQRYHIARGSAMEVGSSLDELVDYKFIPPERVLHAKSLASRIVSMLMGLIRSTRDEPPPGKSQDSTPGRPPADRPPADRPPAGDKPTTGQPAATPDRDRDPDRNP